MRLDLASRRSLSIALGLLVLVFLYGCQAGEQGESRSSEGAAQNSGPMRQGRPGASNLTGRRERSARR